MAKIELTKEIKESIDKSVLCWLTTVSAENIPNVSPKEIFNYFGTDKVIIANIASPQTVCNIKINKNVCISFIDILLQKGFQIKGKAEIIDENSFSAYLNHQKVYFLGDGALKCQEIIKHDNAIFIDAVFPSSKNMSVLAFDKYKKSDFEDVAYFEPFYLKDFIVVPEKKKIQ